MDPVDYKITFVFHLVEKTKPKDFPLLFSYDLLVRVENLDGLRKLTEEYYGKFVKMQGVFLEKEPLRIVSSNFEPDSAFFLPVHMISYVETRTEKLNMKIPDDQNILKLIH